MNTLANINLWHQRARPNPTNANFNVQIGCHFEEVCEMIEALIGDDKGTSAALTTAHAALTELADALKAGEMRVTVPHFLRAHLLDSLADQVVTAVGVGHCAGMDVVEACKVVDLSNWSKFDQHGQPVFNEHGKITKGLGYMPPDLRGLV